MAIVAQAFSQENNWFHHYRLAHNQNNDNIIEDFHLILLELPKFEPQSLQDKKLTALWMRFMTEIDERTRNVDQALLDVPEIREALTLVEEAAYTPEELDAYLRNWDAIKTQRMLMNDTLEEGFEKGIEKGIEQGIEKGKEEERYVIARKSLAKGWDVQTVSEITELSVETIEKMKASILRELRNNAR